MAPFGTLICRGGVVFCMQKRWGIVEILPCAGVPQIGCPNTDPNVLLYF